MPTPISDDERDLVAVPQALLWTPHIRATEARRSGCPGLVVKRFEPAPATSSCLDTARQAGWSTDS